jgi:hypothetical protein
MSTKKRQERMSRSVSGDVLNDMLRACHKYHDDWRQRPDRVELPCDQFDRLCAFLGIKQISFPNIGAIEAKLGQVFDGGAPIKIELRPVGDIQAAQARGPQIIEPPKKPRSIILPKGIGHGRR